jgi:restriction system protein
MPGIISFNDYVHWRTVASDRSSDGYTNMHPPANYCLTPLEAYSYCNRKVGVCYNCNCKLEKQARKIDTDVIQRPHNGGPGETEKEYNIYACTSCGWWCAESRITSYREIGTKEEYDFFESIVKRYKIDDKDIPVQELRRYITDKPELLRRVNPTKCEQIIASIYKDFYNCEVRHVGGPGDGGIDLYAIINDNPILIQVKRSSTAAESVKIVREFVGALILAGQTRGHIVTTAPKFSTASENIINNSNLTRNKIQITLKSFNDIVSMLSLTKEKITTSWENFNFNNTNAFSPNGITIAGYDEGGQYDLTETGELAYWNGPLSYGGGPLSNWREQPIYMG